MELYFTVDEQSDLYKDYFDSLEDAKKVNEAFKTVTEHHGIESTQYYLMRDTLKINPTEADIIKFEKMMRKGVPGLFKANSPVAKEWRELVADIKHMRKPELVWYFKFLGLSCRWRERLFHIGTILYGSIVSDRPVEVPEFVHEIKASEFYRAIEDEEARQKQG